MTNVMQELFQPLSPEEQINPDQQEQVSKENAKKVERIKSECVSIQGTPGETYLRRRGITKDCSGLLYYRPNAFNHFGAVVVMATDDGGNVLAVQQIYVTGDGQKAPFLDVEKRTNKAVEEWAEKSAVRLPGKLPLILTEGPETALSVWQATGHETWACLSVVNIAKAPVPENETVIVARDGDLPGSAADNTMKKTLAKLSERGNTVHVAMPPEEKDFNDVLLKDGEEAVRLLIASASPDQVSNLKKVNIGSDVEIAHRILEDLIAKHGKIIYAEGHFWRYAISQWEQIPDNELRLAVHAYDGARFKTPSGESSCVKLGRGRVDSALNELAALATDPKFFENAPIGINCANGFIRFTVHGTPSIEKHDRDHRCRHTLPGRWNVEAIPLPTEGTLLSRLLTGVFLGDEDAEAKVSLLAEIGGAAALGHATKLKQPRAVIMKGDTAENGKSQILDAISGALPPSAISTITASKMGDERHVVGLVGKLLNVSNELSASSAIASEIFKAVTTGDTIDGRDLYKSRVEFRPIAQHIFATNVLPAFQGGMDRGVRRRLLVVTFNRVIPVEERIEGIGRRIASEEADQLLAWIVDGASRVIRQRNFTLPSSSESALADWIYGADPVLAWLDDCTATQKTHDGFPRIRTNAAYKEFKQYAEQAGFNVDRLPEINTFTSRVKATGVEWKRTKEGPFFFGLVLKRRYTS